ncbi:MAG: hypothetical protein WBG11_08840 [Methylocella sp.]
MTVVTNVLGTNVAVQDSLAPFVALTAGEGAGSHEKMVEDSVALTTALPLSDLGQDQAGAGLFRRRA